MEDRQKSAKRDRKNADAKRKIVAEYKIVMGCADCGYNDNALALEFDHKPGTKGNKTVASMMYYSWDKIWEEIKKCDIVCANCHAIRTLKK